MDTRFLESLIAVVESGSIASAARQQGLTSAAVSQRIIALENELGCKLLTRSSHVAKPTDNCLKILGRVKNIIKDTQDLTDDIHTSEVKGTLRIGAISTALTGILPLALKKLSKIAPHIFPIITPGTSKFLYKELESKRLDVAIIVDPPFIIPKNFSTYTIQSEPLSLISNEHNNESIKDILKKHPYISYDSKSWGGRLAVLYLKDNNIHTNLFCEMDALETIGMMVTQNLGISLVPFWGGLEKYSNGLTIKQINDSKYNRKIVFIFPTNINRLSLIKKFQEVLNIEHPI